MMRQETPGNWHELDHAAVLSQLGTSAEHGLPEAEAAARLDRHGPNRLVSAPGRSAWLRFLLQFHQPLIYILVASGIITALLGEWADSSVILGVVLVNALVGFIQEGRAEDALAALARSVASEVTVLRDGVRRRMDAAGLVPGDMVWLAAGDKVPADLRLVHVRSLQATEAALTGEAAAVGKHVDALPADTLLAEIGRA
ncbi:MAG: cation-transporting P-type ATPase, partial [Zoogloea sp.]|nr:cation-transporting P-type ATPase [Zoogloea sp.]